MKLMGLIVGGLMAVMAFVLAVPGPAQAMPLAPGAGVTLKLDEPTLKEDAQYYYRPRYYRPRYYRPRYYRPRYYRPRVVCRVRYGYYGRRVVCFRL